MSSQPDQDEVVELFNGAEFVAAREQKGLSTEAAATDLNFSVKYLIAIETGRLDDLPDRVFALGYLKAYARYLGLNEEQAVAEYDRVVGRVAGERPGRRGYSSYRHEEHRSGGDGFKKLVVLVLLIAVAAAGFFWWQAQKGLLTEPVSELVTQPAAPPVAPKADPVELSVGREEALSTVPEAPPVVDAMTEEASASVDQLEASVKAIETSVEEVLKDELPTPDAFGDEEGNVIAPADEQAKSETQDGVMTGTDSIAADEVLPDVKSGRLQIEFTADCWTEVRDSGGKLLVASVRNAQRAVDVEGELPFRITLGALSAVERLVLNDEPVELLKRGNGNVLRMTLPAQE
ncbi:MAG: helix-turn-helix domain-containing protein [Pontibacterium sp.]